MSESKNNKTFLNKKIFLNKYTLISIITLITVLVLTLNLRQSTTVNNTLANEYEYVNSIFNSDKILNINIEISESEWQNMLDTAIEEKYVSANISINDIEYENVGIRPKGNSSLSQIYNDDSTDRYSFKIKFDKYVDGQTLDGLSKLVLNNNMSDATYMKEYLSYDLLSTLGVKTPKCTYANITVNNKPWGLYLAVEPIEEEFIERYYGSVSGNLYKPESDSINMGNKDIINYKPNNQTDFDPSQIPSNQQDLQNPPNNNNNNISNIQPPTDIPQGNQPSDIPNNGEMPPNIAQGNNMPGGFGGGMNKDSAGADLVWNGDDISNYSAIFDNVEFKNTTTTDYEKILDMIEHLDTMDDIESYLNVDEVLRYFAVNTFLVNLDSYASNMKHNYYLYEEDGLVTILPWDYNLSFGAFMGGSSSSVVNFPIDSPVSDNLEISPLIGKLLNIDKYKNTYHKYLNEIVENYVNSGIFENTITKIDSLISDYIKDDATAFYSFDEYQNALTNLKIFGIDRTKSILAQLDGSQPSTTTGSLETKLDLTALGQQGGGKDTPKGGGQMNMDGNPMNMENPDINMPDRDIIMKAMEIIQNSEDGVITDEITAQLKELGLTDEFIQQLSLMKHPN